LINNWESTGHHIVQSHGGQWD